MHEKGSNDKINIDVKVKCRIDVCRRGETAILGRFINPDNSAFQVAYYSRGCDSEKMFADLNIARSPSHKQHLNKYDVIYIDVQACLMDVGVAEKTVRYIHENIISELQEAYPEISLTDARTAYGALTRINLATGKRFVVIIDEWDVLIRDKATNKAVQEEYVNFLRGMFKGGDPTKFIALCEVLN